MSFANEAEAANALAQSVVADTAPAPTPEPAATVTPEPTSEQAAAPQQTATTVEQEGATPADAFTNADLSSLTDEQRALVDPFYKSFQADYTRKTQELAAQRRQYEALEQAGGLEAAQQAIEFAQRLNNDPQFQMSLHQQLSSHLQQTGLTPAQASAEASRQMTEAADTDWEDDTQDAVVPPHIEHQLNELRQWKAQVEEERMQTYLANEVQRQEMTIRNQNPHYGDEDFATVYTMAHAYNGDLEAANQAYLAMQSRILGAYAAQKAATPAAVTPPAATGSAIRPTKFGSLDEAHVAAEEFLRTSQAQ